jgi:hypothetical protein
MNSEADLFRKTAAENFPSRLRGNTLFGVERNVIHARMKPTNGPEFPDLWSDSDQLSS